VVQGCVLYVTKDGIFSITVESSTQAMILKAPSQARQLSLSMPSISPTSGLKDPSGCLVSRYYLISKSVPDLTTLCPHSIGKT
jgi:hypothetical protein